MDQVVLEEAGLCCKSLEFRRRNAVACFWINRPQAVASLSQALEVLVTMQVFLDGFFSLKSLTLRARRFGYF